VFGGHRVRNGQSRGEVEKGPARDLAKSRCDWKTATCLLLDTEVNVPSWLGTGSGKLIGHPRTPLGPANSGQGGLTRRQSEPSTLILVLSAEACHRHARPSVAGLSCWPVSGQIAATVWEKGEDAQRRPLHKSPAVP